MKPLPDKQLIDPYFILNFPSLPTQVYSQTTFLRLDSDLKINPYSWVDNPFFIYEYNIDQAQSGQTKVNPTILTLTWIKIQN